MTLAVGLDAVSGEASFGPAAQTLHKSAGKGKLATLLPWSEGTPQPDGVEVIMSEVFEVVNEQPDFVTWLFADFLEEGLRGKTIQVVPAAKMMPGGIAKAQEVLDELKKGVSAQKLVVEVQ